MEPKTPKARPPALIDKAVRLLIPLASREAVVGDLWERYASPLHYAAEALRIAPFLIASQIRRNSNVPLLGIAAVTLFVGFGGFQVAGAAIGAPRWARRRSLEKIQRDRRRSRRHRRRICIFLAGNRRGAADRLGLLDDLSSVHHLVPCQQDFGETVAG